MRKSFILEIQHLEDDLLILGDLVEQQLLNSVEAFKNRDIKASQAIRKIDEEVNARRYAIEEKVLMTIATQQPMAKDLRHLASILEIAGELERMGDYAKGIAKINVDMGEEELITPLVIIPRMADQCVSMLHRALTAFINKDVEEARVIPAADDEIDTMYSQVYVNLIRMIGRDENSIQRANWILWVAHNLERVADRVTNICERTIFTVTGELKEIRSSDQ